MRRLALVGLTGLVVLCVGLLIWPDVGPLLAQSETPAAAITGRLITEQGELIAVAEIVAFVDGAAEPVATAESQENGSFLLALPVIPTDTLRIEVERHHFAAYHHDLSPAEVTQLQTDRVINLGKINLQRVITPGFWVAGITFVVALVLIAIERLKNALAALVGMSIIFIFTYIGGIFIPGLYVLDFERALSFINWEVIFLVMGMMIVVGIIEGTGIFQWMTFMAYRISRGRVSWLIIVLIVITSVASALLDNVTTMLLMAPISIQIALALGISPLALLIPEILASNVSGISTLIGTPTNILIGSYAGIGFNDFLINQTPGVLAAMIVMTASVLFYYRADIRQHSGGISPTLYARLKQNATIKSRDDLRRSLIVFGGMLFFFAVGENIHMVPAVTSLVGATILLIWCESDITKMLGVVDWTTLVFFMGLFMMVGALQEVGILSWIATTMGHWIGESIPIGILVLVVGVGLMSFVIANVPLAAAMLPVVRFLTLSVPGAESNVFFYALSMGAAMGGNGTLIGGETNLMTAGIAERAGYPIKFSEFIKVGVPVTLLTLATGAGWLYIRFVLFGG